MSKTDKTRPCRVKMDEYRVCFPRVGPDDRLMWYRTHEWWRAEFRCGCSMCGPDAYQTPRRKKQRMEGKKQCRDWEE